MPDLSERVNMEGYNSNLPCISTSTRCLNPSRTCPRHELRERISWISDASLMLRNSSELLINLTWIITDPSEMYDGISGVNYQIVDMQIIPTEEKENLSPVYPCPLNTDTSTLSLFYVVFDLTCNCGCEKGFTTEVTLKFT